MGLAEVKDVGAVGHHIVTEREKKGPFKDLHDLMTRVITPGKNGGYDAKLASGAVQGLIEAGALDVFGPRLGLLMTMRAAHKGAITPIEGRLERRGNVHPAAVPPRRQPRHPPADIHER